MDALGSMFVVVHWARKTSASLTSSIAAQVCASPKTCSKIFPTFVKLCLFHTCLFIKWLLHVLVNCLYKYESASFSFDSKEDSYYAPAVNVVPDLGGPCRRPAPVPATTSAKKLRDFSCRCTSRCIVSLVPDSRASLSKHFLPQSVFSVFSVKSHPQVFYINAKP